MNANSAKEVSEGNQGKGNGSNPNKVEGATTTANQVVNTNAASQGSNEKSNKANNAEGAEGAQVGNANNAAEVTKQTSEGSNNAANISVRISKLEEEITGLETELEQARTDLESKEKKLAELKKSNTSKSNTSKSNTSKSRTLRKTLRGGGKAEEIAALEKEIEQIKTKITDLETKISAKKEELKKIQAKPQESGAENGQGSAENGQGGANNGQDGAEEDGAEQPQPTVLPCETNSHSLRVRTNVKVREKLRTDQTGPKPVYDYIDQPLNIFGDIYYLGDKYPIEDMRGGFKNLTRFLAEYGINPDHGLDIATIIKAFFVVFPNKSKAGLPRDTSPSDEEKFTTGLDVEGKLRDKLCNGKKKPITIPSGPYKISDEPAFHYICGFLNHRIFTLKAEMTLYNRNDLRRAELKRQADAINKLLKEGECHKMPENQAKAAFLGAISTPSSAATATAADANPKLDFIIKLLKGVISTMVDCDEIKRIGDELNELKKLGKGETPELKRMFDMLYATRGIACKPKSGVSTPVSTQFSKVLELLNAPVIDEEAVKKIAGGMGKDGDLVLALLDYKMGRGPEKAQAVVSANVAELQKEIKFIVNNITGILDRLGLEYDKINPSPKNKILILMKYISDKQQELKAKNTELKVQTEKVAALEEQLKTATGADVGQLQAEIAGLRTSGADPSVITRLEAEKAELQAQLGTKQTELNNLTAELENNRVSLSDITERYHIMEDALRNRPDDSELQAQIESLSIQKAELEAAKNALQSRLDTELAELRSQLEAATQAKDAATTAAAEAQAALQQLQSTTTDTGADLEAARAAQAAAQAELETAQTALRAAEARERELTNEYGEALNLMGAQHQEELNEAQETLRTAQQRIAKLEKSSSASQADNIAAARAAEQAAKSQLADVEARAAKLRVELDAMRAAHKTALTEAQQELAAKEAALKALQASAGTTQAELAAANAALAAARREAEEAVHRVQADHAAALKTKADELESIGRRLAEAQRERQDALAAAQKARENAAADAKSIRISAGNQVKSVSDELRSREAALSQAQARIEELQRDFDRAKEALKNELGAKDKAIQNLQSELAAAKGELESLRPSAAATDVAQKKVLELERKIRTIEDELKGLRTSDDAKQRAEAQVAELTKKLSAKQAELQNLEQQLAAATDTLQRMQSGEAAKQGALDAAQSKVVELQKQLADAEVGVEFFSSSLAAAEAELTNATSRIAELTSQLEEARRKLTTPAAQLSSKEELQAELANIKEQLQRMAEANAIQEDSINRLQEDLEVTNRDLTQVTTEKENLNNKLIVLQSQIPQLEREITNLRNRLGESELALGTSEETVRSQAKTIAELKTALDAASQGSLSHPKILCDFIKSKVELYRKFAPKLVEKYTTFLISKDIESHINLLMELLNILNNRIGLNNDSFVFKTDAFDGSIKLLADIRKELLPVNTSESGSTELLSKLTKEYEELNNLERHNLSISQLTVPRYLLTVPNTITDIKNNSQLQKKYITFFTYTEPTLFYFAPNFSKVISYLEHQEMPWSSSPMISSGSNSVSFQQVYYPTSKGTPVHTEVASIPNVSRTLLEIVLHLAIDKYLRESNLCAAEM